MEAMETTKSHVFLQQPKDLENQHPMNTTIPRNTFTQKYNKSNEKISRNAIIQNINSISEAKNENQTQPKSTSEFRTTNSEAYKSTTTDNPR